MSPGYPIDPLRRQFERFWWNPWLLKLVAENPENRGLHWGEN
jgi:hypothetical protein